MASAEVAEHRQPSRRAQENAGERCGACRRRTGLSGARQVVIGLAASVLLTTVQAFCTQVPTAAIRAIATTVIRPIRMVYSTIVAPDSSAAKRFMKILIFLPFARQSHTQDLCSMHRLSKSGNCLILLDNYD